MFDDYNWPLHQVCQAGDLRGLIMYKRKNEMKMKVEDFLILIFFLKKLFPLHKFNMSQQNSFDSN